MAFEGYCGSGAQIDWLRREEFKLLPADTGVLMIHAINPYGFAWTRRVNEDNVDLNRNWVDFSEPLPTNPGYVELAEILCPSEWTAEAQEATARNMAAWQASRGARGAADFRQAVTGGQYTHPLGLFFGGSGPSWSRRTQTAIFQKYLARAKRVGVIDYHTGLGPWGYAERLTVFRPEEPEFKRAATWFGAAVTSTKSGTAASKDVSGDNISGSAALLPQAEFTGIGFEVGTVPTPRFYRPSAPTPGSMPMAIRSRSKDDKSRLKSAPHSIAKVTRGKAWLRGNRCCRADRRSPGFRSKPAFRPLDQVVVRSISNVLRVEGARAARP